MKMYKVLDTNNNKGFKPELINKSFEGEIAGEYIRLNVNNEIVTFLANEVVEIQAIENTTNYDIKIVPAYSNNFIQTSNSSYRFKYDSIEVDIFERDNKSILISNIAHKKGNTEFIKMCYSEYKRSKTELENIKATLNSKLNNFCNIYNVQLQDIQLTQQADKNVIFALIFVNGDRKGHILLDANTMNIIEAKRGSKSIMHLFETITEAHEEIAATKLIRTTENTTNSSYCYNELQDLKLKGDAIYDKIIERRKELNNLNIATIDYKDDSIYYNLNKQLDLIESNENELKELLISDMSKEYKNKCIALQQEYKDNRYKAIYNNGTIQYYKHRKDVDIVNAVNIIELQITNDNRSVQEVGVYSNKNSYKTIHFYEKNKILALMENRIYNKDILKEYHINRNDFKLSLINNTLNIVFEVGNNTSIEYYFSNVKSNNYSIQIRPGFIMANWFYVKSLDKEYNDKVKIILNKYIKDKHIKNTIEKIKDQIA